MPERIDSMRVTPGHRQWASSDRLGLVGVTMLACALVMLLGVACSRAQSEPVAPATLVAPESLLAVTADDLPAVVRARYRLRPDRRLLDAVAATRRLRTGGAPEPVRADFAAGKWRVFSGGDEVGALSEYPSFEEATELLVRWSIHLGPPAAATGAIGASAADADLQSLERAVLAVDATALIDALARLGNSPVGIQDDPAKVRVVASGLAWLATLTVDHLEQADPLLAEAWAWLALERANAEPRSADGEVLLARALGYEAAAAQASAKLAEEHPVRHYANGDEPRLGALCATRLADRPCHFLRLLLLAEREQVERYRSALRASPFDGDRSLAVLGLETRVADFDGGPEPGRSLAAVAMQAASPRSGLPDATPEASTRALETAADRLASTPTARAVNGAAVRAAVRAAFYSGLAQQAIFFIDGLASGPSTQQLAARMKQPAPGTADELRRWIELMGSVEGGSTDMAPVAALLQSARSIGGARSFDLAMVLFDHLQSTEPLRRHPLPALFERLDTRPSHLVVAANLARRGLMSPGLFEDFARAAAAAAPHLSDELPATVAQLDEDAARLRAIAGDPAMPSYAHIIALHALAELGRADDAFVRAGYEAIAADPDEGTSPLVRFLESRDDFAGAIAALDATIQRNRPEGLALAYFVTEKARLQLRLGKPDLAHATIEPVLRYYKEDTLLQAAAIELARNHAARALELAQAALERYPNNSSETSGLIARARWQLGDYDTAAKELAATRNGIVGPWNRYLPEGFAASFATAPEESTRRAFDALAAAGIAPHVLANVAIALGRERGLAIAVPLLEGLQDPAPEWQNHIRLAGYELIKEKSDADAALVWLRKQIPDRAHQLALHLYQMRNYELLLGLFTNPEATSAPGVVRVLSAASLLHLGETTGPRWEALAASIKADATGDFFAHVGRYLAGQADDGPMVQAITDIRGVASVGWAKGVKAMSERRFGEADAWFQVALETGEHSQPPHAWAWGIEQDWLHSGRSLAILETRPPEASPVQARR